MSRKSIQFSSQERCFCALYSRGYTAGAFTCSQWTYELRLSSSIVHLLILLSFWEGRICNGWNHDFNQKVIVQCSVSSNTCSWKVGKNLQNSHEWLRFLQSCKLKLKHLWKIIFEKMVDEWKSLIIFAKSSILEVLLGTEFASVFCFLYHFSTIIPKPRFINPRLIKLLLWDSNPQQEILGVDSL